MVLVAFAGKFYAIRRPIDRFPRGLEDDDFVLIPCIPKIALCPGVVGLRRCKLANWERPACLRITSSFEHVKFFNNGIPCYAQSFRKLNDLDLC